MGQGKAAVDFRFVGIFRSEELVKLFFGINFPGVLFAEFQCALVEAVLDFFQNVADLSVEIFA